MLRASRASAHVVAASTSAAPLASTARVVVRKSAAAPPSSSRTFSCSAHVHQATEQGQSSGSSGKGKGKASDGNAASSSSSSQSSPRWFDSIKKKASSVLRFNKQQQEQQAAATSSQSQRSAASNNPSAQNVPSSSSSSDAQSARDDPQFVAALNATAQALRARKSRKLSKRQRQAKKAAEAAARTDGTQQQSSKPSASAPGPVPTAAETNQGGPATMKEAAAAPSGDSGPSQKQSAPAAATSSTTKQQARGKGATLRRQRQRRRRVAARKAAATPPAKAKKQEEKAATPQQQNDVKDKGKQQQASGAKSPRLPHQWQQDAIPQVTQSERLAAQEQARREADEASMAEAAAAGGQQPSSGPSASDAPLEDTRAPRRRRPPPHLNASKSGPAMRLVEGPELEALRNISSSLYTPDEEWEAIPFEQREKNGGADLLRRGGILRAADVPVEGIDGLREMKVATLAHGLDRVLFNPGVHQLRDPRSGIYNYPPHLRQIPDVDLFDYGALPAYVTSSADMELIEIAQKQGAKWCGSTSSLTSIFSHAYFLLSGWKAPESKDFTSEFRGDAVPKGFSFAAKLPATINFTPRITPGNPRPVYAIDSNSSDSGEDANSNYVLLQLGKAMEKMLTVDRGEFDSFLRVNRPDDASAGEDGAESTPAQATPEPEAYYYSRAGSSFVMRSQLDCHDSRLPRKTFDLKSRACVSIRYDRANWVEASGYQIKHLHGLWESFERERYDMTRSAFLKYYFQGRIGNMDGIFVAYHNAAKFFGFEYFPLEEMAKQLFGSAEMAEQSFKLCISLTERVLGRAAELYPGKPLRLTFETVEPYRNSSSPSSQSPPSDGPPAAAPAPPDTMRVWIRPRDEEGKPVQGEITQLDVTVDRYIFGRLVQGPVDFNAIDGEISAIQAKEKAEEQLQTETAFERDAHKNRDSSAAAASGNDGFKRPVDWHVEYSLVARTDLSEGEARANLDSALDRAKQLASLVTPNVDAINERERNLEAELARNPAALLKYKRDKQSGVAAGMPKARGQVELFGLGEEEIEVDEQAHTDVRPAAEEPKPFGPPLEEATAAMPSTSGKEQIEEMARVVNAERKKSSLGEGEDGDGLWRPPTMLISAMRVKSRQGAKEAKELEARDELVEFRSTSEGPRR